MNLDPARILRMRNTCGIRNLDGTICLASHGVVNAPASPLPAGWAAVRVDPNGPPLPLCPLHVSRGWALARDIFARASS